MGMRAAGRRRWTIEEVERLIDERPGLTPRYELVDGELLVTPAPSLRHQRVILRLALMLQPYLVDAKVGEVRLGPAELKLVSGEHYEPDLFVIPLIDGRLPREKRDGPDHPLLVVEALSPGSLRHDRFTKRRAFQRAAIPDYWIADSDAELFEIWHPGDERPAVVEDRLIWQPGGAPMAFELDVRQLFADTADGAEVR
jgi:Uma2 family endonuclease